MRKLGFIFICLLSMSQIQLVEAQKKVYADYHGTRRTRLVDGDLGEWKYFSQLNSNPVGLKHVTYNPDLILENGQHDIAAANYPLVGMQSQLDPLYIEYQILSAKSAGIDGFFVEWGYIDHTSNRLLKAIKEVAAKYEFEVGVNICDGWLMQKNWYPGTRAEKLQYFLICMQYLIDEVFTGPTAPIVNGKPLFYLFHDGFTQDEFSAVRSHAYNYPEDYPIKSGNKFPDVLMRIMLSPTLVGGVYTPKSPIAQAGSWVNTNRVVPTSWIPERIRNAAGIYPDYARYATTDDCVTFVKAFKDNVWTMGYLPRAGLVIPGMDNYGCAGWGPNGTLYLIPREDGDTYRTMWDFHVQNRNSLDMVYIASWSDYTEGHEIEPTVENGDRELRTTLQYASQFKGESSYDESGIDLAYELFLLRKEVEFFANNKISTEALGAQLDAIALKISEKAYVEAANMMQMAKDDHGAIRQNITSQDYHIDASQLIITGNKNENDEYVLSGSRTGITINHPELRAALESKYYEGYMNYEYWDDTWGKNTNIVSGTDKQPRDLFKFIGQIKDKGDKKWVNAKIRLYKENIKYGQESQGSDISFYGDASQTSKIRNVSFDFTVFTAENTNAVSYPNRDIKINHYQVDNVLYVNLGDDVSMSDCVFNIYNQNGQLILSEKSAEQTTAIDLQALSKGVYVLSVQTNNAYYNSKIML